MHAFTDAKGREWTVEVTVATVKRVWGLLGLDLQAGETVIERVWADLVFTVDLLYAVCKPQAEGCGIDETAFAEGLAGDALRDGRRALIEALIGFFPDETFRETLRKVDSKVIEAREAILSDLAQRAEALDLTPEIRQAIESVGNVCGSSPASAGLTPTP